MVIIILDWKIIYDGVLQAKEYEEQCGFAYGTLFEIHNMACKRRQQGKKEILFQTQKL